MSIEHPQLAPGRPEEPTSVTEAGSVLATSAACMRVPPYLTVAHRQRETESRNPYYSFRETVPECDHVSMQTTSSLHPIPFGFQRSNASFAQMVNNLSPASSFICCCSRSSLLGSRYHQTVQLIPWLILKRPLWGKPALGRRAVGVCEVAP